MGTTPSTSLTLTVPARVDIFIKDRVASGRFETAGDVVGAAIALLAERERLREAVIDEIRREILIGTSQAAAGQVRDVVRPVPPHGSGTP